MKRKGIKVIKLSACCQAPVRSEIWVSKIRRKVYFCTKCGNICRPLIIQTESDAE